MNELYRKNEFETNEIVSKSIRILFLFIMLIGALCWIHIFNVSNNMINGFILVSIVPLLLPTILVDLFHISKGWVKYVLLLCVIIFTGIAYVVFTFQTVIIFVVPAIISVMYLDKKMFYFSEVIMCINIVIVHFITGFYLFQPWIEPFTNLRFIMLYGAVPRLLQFLCCSALLYILSKRFISFLNSYQQVMEEEKQKHISRNENNIDQNNINQNNINQNNIDQNNINQDDELKVLLRELTEREIDVFTLLVQGYTNTQISNYLHLSVGTVKNYVSLIYNKVGTKDRTALVLKYSSYLHKCD